MTKTSKSKTVAYYTYSTTTSIITILVLVLYQIAKQFAKLSGVVSSYDINFLYNIIKSHDLVISAKMCARKEKRGTIYNKVDRM